MGNIQAVMDGDIDGFINAYLTAAANGEIKKNKGRQPSMTSPLCGVQAFCLRQNLGRAEFISDRHGLIRGPQSPALRGNGDIDGFINAYLTAAANGEIKK